MDTPMEKELPHQKTDLQKTSDVSTQQYLVDKNKAAAMLVLERMSRALGASQVSTTTIVKRVEKL